MKNKYCIGEFLSSCYALFLTKVFYKPARLIRRPLYLRGKKSFVIGNGLTIGHSCRFDLDGHRKTLFVGDNCQFGDNTHIVALNEVKIGNNVLIASKVFISDTSHGNYRGSNQDNPIEAPNSRKLVSSHVFIGDNVWIGENVVVLPGAYIGKGCIIGANSVINGKYDDNSILVGSPARVVKKWDQKTNEWRKTDNGSIL